MIWWVASISAVVVLLWIAHQLGQRTQDRRTAAAVNAAKKKLSQRVEQLVSVQDLGIALSESMDANEVGERVARYVFAALPTEGVIVALLADEAPRIRVVSAVGSLEHFSGARFAEDPPTAISRAIVEGKTRNLGADPESLIDFVPGVAFPSGTAAPMRAHGENVGAIGIITADDAALTPADMRLLSAVGGHAALVLANARLIGLLREGRDQLERVFDAITAGIAVLDAHHLIRRVNDSLANLLSDSRESIIGTHLCERLFGPANELHPLIESVRRGDEHQGITAHSHMLDRTLRVTAAPTWGTFADEGWVVALIDDVTEVRAMERRLIQNERMVAVGQLVSGVAHELNNPLTSIAGLAELLMSRGGGPPENEEHLGVVREQANRAKKIVENLLAFARKGPDEPTQIDLSDLCQRAARLMGYEIKLHDIELETDLAKDLPLVRGDRYQLQQVVVNLLTNAVQAVDQPNTSPERRVRVATGSRGDRVFLRVSDTGPGISRKALPNLFTPFFTTKDPGQGTGLGLSVSFGIVEGHSGTLSVEDTGAGGTTFRVDLPASNGGVKTPTTDEMECPEPVPNFRATVLLIDADLGVRRMIEALFSGQGQSVETPDAAEALTLIQQDPDRFDLIIADARVATSRGETFVEALLRARPELRTRTIVVTADVRPETNRWLEGTGCRYFRKPFNVRELLAAAAEIRHRATSNPAEAS